MKQISKEQLHTLLNQTPVKIYYGGTLDLKEADKPLKKVLNNVDANMHMEPIGGIKGQWVQRRHIKVGTSKVYVTSEKEQEFWHFMGFETNRKAVVLYDPKQHKIRGYVLYFKKGG